MRVLIVSPCDLPVPAVCGGAVASLMESILKVNEEKNEIDITLVSSWHEKAEQQSAKYKRTKFIWIKVPGICQRFDELTGKLTASFRKNSRSKEYTRKLYVISRLKKILSEGEYDAVVVQNSGYLLKAFSDKVLAEKYAGKIYYHLHNDIPGNADDSILKDTKFMLISRYLLKGVTAKCGADAEKRSYIVKNGICCEKFQKQLSAEEKSQIKERLAISEDKKVIVFVGRIVDSKGIGELLDAVAAMNDPSIVLLVIGSTNFGASDKSPFECTIEKKCQELGEQVRFTGFIHNDEVWKYYKTGDLAVLPSKWEEPAGLTMIEAAAAGLPVVTTVSGGIPEYLNSDYAVLVDKDNNLTGNLQDAISRVLSDLDVWKETGSRASQYVSDNFSEAAFYDSFVKALK